MRAPAPSSRRRLRKWGIARALALALAAWWTLPVAAQERPTEQSLRAAMLFNFLKFTEFPQEATATDPQRLRICFSVGDPAQAEALVGLAGRKAGNRELVIARLADRSDNCAVIYVDSRQRWNAALENRSVGSALTIGSYRDFVADGGILEIDVQPDGNRFDVNLAQARVARLRLSPQLLRLARRIHE